MAARRVLDDAVLDAVEQVTLLDNSPMNRGILGCRDDPGLR